jgi:ABC-2 type transport system permease protein
VLHIPINILSVNQASLISDKQVTIDIKNLIENRLNKLIENDKRQQIIAESGIPDLDKRLSATRTNINLSTIKLGEEGKANKRFNRNGHGSRLYFRLPYLHVCFDVRHDGHAWGNGRKIKPNCRGDYFICKTIPALFGKIVGIGLVGLTQVAIWVVLGFSISTGIHVFFGGAGAGSAARAQSIVSPEVMNQAGTQVASNNQVLQVLDAIGNSIYS